VNNIVLQVVLWYFGNMVRQIILISALLTTFAFGMSGIGSMDMIGHMNGQSCLFMMFSNGDCHSLSNTFSLALHHISGMQNVFAVDAVSSLGIFTALLLAIVVFIFSRTALGEGVVVKVGLFRYVISVMRACLYTAERHIQEWIAMKFYVYSFVREGV
jgi:hypothetical protein